MSKKRQTLRATIYDKRGKVLSVGENSYHKSHPKQAEFAKIAGREEAIYLHAEIAAIIKLKEKADDAYKIFIERYNTNGQPLLAKPCEICEIALEMAGITVIEYTGDE
jgi:tRNA(Arg) A34 adenosine deaminase TadA